MLRKMNSRTKFYSSKSFAEKVSPVDGDSPFRVNLYVAFSVQMLMIQK